MACEISVDIARGEFGSGERCRAVAAVADDLGGDALSNGAYRPGIGVEGKVGVAVDIDKTRSDEQVGGIEVGYFGIVGDGADFGDASIGDGQVGAKSRFAAAVGDQAAADDQFREHRLGAGFGLPRGRRQRSLGPGLRRSAGGPPRARPCRF